MARLHEMTRVRDFRLHAWVVMPEHVHVLLMPPPGAPAVGRAMAHAKQLFSQDVIRRWRTLRAPILERITDRQGRVRFWQPGGGYDRNIFSDEERVEKAAYIEANPVRRGLVNRPEEWRWSSAWREE